MTAGPRAAGALLAPLVLAGCGTLPFSSGEGAPAPVTGMVVSEHALATEVGVEVLAAGGNAADAAVATSLALAVVYPMAGNLGGGGFALWVPHAVVPGEDEVLALDFRERAPAALTEEVFLDEEGNHVPERSLWTHLAAGVPGSPAGLEALHRAHGDLSWAAVCAPAIRLARDGFVVDPWLARSLASEGMRTRLTRDPDAAAIFYPGGRPLEEGDRLVQPDLADTLQRLSDRGAAAGFYSGPTAELVAAEMAAGGGVMTAADLAAYAPVERDPLVGWFRGQEVISFPPPSSGGVVLLQVLAVLDGFPLGAERGPDGGPGERDAHLLVEALRLAFADRAEHLGDPDHWDVPLELLLSRELVNDRRTRLGERATPDVRAAVVPPAPESDETTHVSVLDGEGNAVSLTTTLNASFGSGHVVAGAGFLLNNEIDDFAVQPDAPNLFGLLGGEANAIRPHKRPLSSMTPTVVRDGGRCNTLVLGSPGGPRIITAVLQVLLRSEVYGQPLEEAVHAPRLHQQWAPTATRFEEGWDPALLEALRARGHEVEVTRGSQGSVQAIRVEPGGAPVGVSDPRRGGTAWGPGLPKPIPRRPR